MSVKTSFYCHSMESPANKSNLLPSIIARACHLYRLGVMLDFQQNGRYYDEKRYSPCIHAYRCRGRKQEAPLPLVSAKSQKVTGLGKP